MHRFCFAPFSSFLRVIRVTFLVGLFPALCLSEPANGFVRVSDRLFTSPKGDVVLVITDEGLFVSTPQRAIDPLALTPDSFAPSDTDLFVRFDHNSDRYSELIIRKNRWPLRELTAFSIAQRVKLRVLNSPTPYISIVLEDNSALLAIRRDTVMLQTTSAEVIAILAGSILGPLYDRSYETDSNHQIIAAGKPLPSDVQLGFALSSENNPCLDPKAVFFRQEDIDRLKRLGDSMQVEVLSKLINDPKRSARILEEVGIPLQITKERVLALSSAGDRIVEIRRLDSPNRVLCTLQEIAL